MTLRWLRRFGRIRFLSNRWLGFTKRLQLKLQLERLEDRVTPTTNTWNIATGGAWGTAGEWSLRPMPPKAGEMGFSGINASGAGPTNTPHNETTKPPPHHPPQK